MSNYSNYTNVPTISVFGIPASTSRGLYPPTNKMALVQETAITGFQSGHGWTRQSAGGTQSDDSTVYLRGTQSLKLITPSGGTCTTRSATISPTIDMSGKLPIIRVMVDNPTNLTELWVYMSSDNMATAWYNFKISDDITQIKANEWTTLTLSFGKATLTNAPTRSAINCIQIRTTSATSQIVNIWVDRLGYVAEPSQGYCIVTFDDGYDNTYTQGALKLSQYNYPAVLYVEPETVGTSGRVTLAQLQTLQNFNGWDISVHSGTDFTTLSNNDLEVLFQTNKEYLLANSLNKGANHVAYPMGHHNATVRNVAQKYFVTGRSIESYAETMPLFSPYNLRVFLVVNTTTTGSIITAINQAVTNKELLILVFHQLVANPTVSTQYSIVNFGGAVDAIHTANIPVTTLSSLFG
jgi:hypothetical protein